MISFKKRPGSLPAEPLRAETALNLPLREHESQRQTERTCLVSPAAPIHRAPFSEKTPSELIAMSLWISSG